MPLIVLAAALVLWSLTRTQLPICYAAAIAGIAFVLAVDAVIREHDRSPLLLVPLLFVPLAVAAWLAFVILSR